MTKLQSLFWPIMALITATGAGDPAPNAPTAWPVKIEHIARSNPNESVWKATIDLIDPRVSVHVDRGGPAPKDDPTTDGPWVTTLLPTSEIAARDGWDLAVNGDFFQALKTVDIEGKDTGFVRGKLARPLGPAVTDGVEWQTNATTRPALEITADHKAHIVEVDANAKLPADVREAIAGSQIIVRDGKRISDKSKFATDRHPRTAVGLDADGTHLILLVVDGRQQKLSVGMTLDELADEMIAAGAVTALNLDGGGSSTLVAKDRETGNLKIENSPSDTKERSVADALGIVVKN
jgi:exopolysaccharide biosynthesis protein